MSGLVAKSRVSWGLVVVTQEGKKYLHLIKKNYRGVVSYYSKSARGVTDKVGFGEVNIKGTLCAIFLSVLCLLGNIMSDWF